ncbi:MAG: hypothetical protein P1U74_05175 [Legionellaceae bacterium]|nr:hypothetical protein [Legionellaceae bacterium]
MRRKNFFSVAFFLCALPISLNAQNCSKSADCDDWVKDHCACGVGPLCGEMNWSTNQGSCKCDGEYGDQHNCNSSDNVIIFDSDDGVVPPRMRAGPRGRRW